MELPRLSWLSQDFAAVPTDYSHMKYDRRVSSFWVSIIDTLRRHDEDALVRIDTNLRATPNGDEDCALEIVPRAVMAGR